MLNPRIGTASSDSNSAEWLARYPAEVLAALADELGCDHIVMGTRGLGAISGIVLGSVTRKVLHLTRIPVTCIKHPA